jgi:hypothetical protein
MVETYDDEDERMNAQIEPCYQPNCGNMCEVLSRFMQCTYSSNKMAPTFSGLKHCVACPACGYIGRNEDTKASAIVAHNTIAKALRSKVEPYPTFDAYEAACKALEKHRVRADTAEQELHRLKSYFSNCAATIAPDRWGHALRKIADIVMGPSESFTTDSLVRGVQRLKWQLGQYASFDTLQRILDNTNQTNKQLAFILDDKGIKGPHTHKLKQALRDQENTVDNLKFRLCKLQETVKEACQELANMSMAVTTGDNIYDLVHCTKQYINTLRAKSEQLDAHYRWEVGLRNVAGIFFGPDKKFEIVDVVESVKALYNKQPVLEEEIRQLKEKVRVKDGWMAHEEIKK